MALSFSNPSPFQNPQTQQQQSNLFSSFAQPQQQQMQQFQFQPQQQQQLQPQQQQMYLYTVDKSPAIYSTKWADLLPESQKLLLQIEERILGYKDESQRLDQCTRLYDSSISNNSFEFLINHIKQEMGRASNIISREKTSVKELTNDTKIIMWNTEKAVRSYMMLKPPLLPQNSSTTSNSISTSQTTNASQPNSSSMASSYGFYSGFPKRPSPFMQHTFERFEKYLAECGQMIQELEQLVLMNSDKKSSNSGLMLIESLPTVMTNVHDIFVHVAAKVENLHQYIESMKTAYLANQRRRGEENNPFIEADRREIAKQEAAAKRVHPTMNLLTNTSTSAPPQSTQGAGLFASSSMPLLSSNVQQQPIVSPSPFSSNGSGLSLFNTTAASASTSSLFSTPITSNNNTTSNLFSTPATTGFSTPQSTSLFGSAQSSSLFGSTPAPTPTPTPTPTFGSTPTAGSSLFSTPTLNTGGQTGSMASFGAASKPSRPKSRNARR